MESVILGNYNLCVEVAYADSQRELFQRLLSFITPNFEVLDSPTGSLDMHLTLHPHVNFLTDWKAACKDEACIRRSTAEAFNLVLRRGQLHDGRYLAWHQRDQTGYVWQQGSKQMAMYTNPQSFIHVIEFFRYYLLALEAVKGSLILHATGVENCATGNVVAICGVKGAGKTSTMLNLIDSGSFRYFSGDKLLVDIHENKLRVRGWPDYPHVGAGSLRQHPELCYKIGLSLHRPPLSMAADGDKFLFAPELFYGALGKAAISRTTVEALVLPEVLAEQQAIVEVDSWQKQDMDASRLFEDPLSFITATWHGLALPEQRVTRLAQHQAVRDRLYQLNWLSLSGLVPAETLTSWLRQRTQLRLALVASSGSGKSTTARLLKEILHQRGLSVSTEKLAQPLYSLQRAYFHELAQPIEGDNQHQLLMEKIADNLRMIDSQSLINHLFSRLQHNTSEVILTDDLRDSQTDWPALVEQGFVVIRILCDEARRQQRLNSRQDLQSQFKSVLDDDINSITPDLVLDNNGDLGALKKAVIQLVDTLLRGRNE